MCRVPSVLLANRRLKYTSYHFILLNKIGDLLLDQLVSVLVMAHL
jgi:hypothetical protein